MFHRSSLQGTAGPALPEDGPEQVCSLLSSHLLVYIWSWLPVILCLSVNPFGNQSPLSSHVFLCVASHTKASTCFSFSRQLQVETKFLLRVCSQVKSTNCKLLIFISWLATQGSSS
ncbi:hypothetical protein ILYODFUR_039040 [Ilyodon furcidens]|uniref:Uncharacterized protein n=1 Tax=Ilyodon furcidens TaxID=33524 RepID=A0ABV0SSV1_9TELE